MCLQNSGQRALKYSLELPTSSLPDMVQRKGNTRHRTYGTKLFFVAELRLRGFAVNSTTNIKMDVQNNNGMVGGLHIDPRYQDVWSQAGFRFENLVAGARSIRLRFAIIKLI